MSQEPLTEAIQHYLREIYKLGQEARTRRFRDGARPRAERLGGVGERDGEEARGADARGARAVRRRVAHAAGERVALEVIRHHRLLELYLAETLGVDVEDVHDEADRLEHAISEELEARIDKALGFPTHDPHGDPIPDANLRWPHAAYG